MRYRKKPVEIEAVQFEGTIASADEIGKLASVPIAFTPEKTLNIVTLEGTMEAQPGDYVIRGVQGEIYPCKPDIFEQTYEKVEG